MLSRRDFTRLLTLGGSTALVPEPLLAWPAPLQSTPDRPDERFWQSVRKQFLMPPDLAVMNAANLCPSPAPVLEAVYRHTKDMDHDPSFENREKMQQGKEEARRVVARSLRVTPEEIVLTRNTSEANNLVSSGLDLKSGDEVLIFSDNHPSNGAAWQQKAKRFGYSVSVIEQPKPHPGPAVLGGSGRESDHAADSSARVLAPDQYGRGHSSRNGVMPTREGAESSP